MQLARQIALGTLAAGVASCGYPDFTYGTPGSSSGGAPTCVVTHAGGGTCEYLPGVGCGCSGADKCGVVDQATGRSACTRAGPTPTHQKCSSDNDCVAGAFCAPVTGACAAICENVADCAPGAQCIPAQSATGAVIPGLKLCTAHCDPVSAAPCGQNLNCIYYPDITEFDCFRSSRLKEDIDCQFSSECDKGLVCVQRTSADRLACRPWCKPATGMASDACPSNKPFCVPLTTAADYNGVEYGACFAK
jgi:hypothetical protein